LPKVPKKLDKSNRFWSEFVAYWGKVGTPRIKESGYPVHTMPVWAQHSTLADEIQANAAARFPETDLKQVFWKRGSGQEGRKSLI
jgi:hypothetical protein